MPVFLSEPMSDQPASLPFRFTGGFAFSSKTIGFMLAMQGIYSLLAQFFFFPLAAKCFGVLKTYRCVIMSWPLLYFSVPYLVLLPQRLQTFGVYFCLLWKITAQVLAFPSIAILLTNSAPSFLVLGVINGVSASTASLARAFGPTITGVIHSWSLEVGFTGLAWWASGFICIVGAVQSLWMEDVYGRMDGPDDDNNRDDEDVDACGETLIDPLAIDAAISAAEGSAERLSDDTPYPQATRSEISN